MQAHFLLLLLLLVHAQVGQPMQHGRQPRSSIKALDSYVALGQQQQTEAALPAGSTPTRRASGPTQWAAGHATHPVSSTQRQLSAAPAALAPAAGCPSVWARVSAPGCRCTVYHDDNRPGNSSSSSSDDALQVNMCPAGFRCSPSTAAAVLSAGWSFDGNVTAPNADDLLTDHGICIPCQLGEFCPVGSREETLLSLSACDFQVQAIAGPASASASMTADGRASRRRRDSLAKPSLSSGSCSGVKLCPAGSYCPSAAEQRPCEPGRWCPEGSTKSQPCNITGMLVWNPFKKAPGGTELILEALVKSSKPLHGNSCPFNATNPLQGCPAGYFCPTAAEKLPCPFGFFCPGHTSEPVPCPVLGSCMSHKQIEPDWSALGVALMLVLLVVLLMVLEYARVAGRCCRKAQSREDDVMQLIEAVGFKMVGTHGDYHVSRSSSSKAAPQTQGGLQSLLQQATALQEVPAIRSSRQALARALRGVSGLWRKEQRTSLPVSKYDSPHAVLSVKGDPGRGGHPPAPSSRFAWLHNWHAHQSGKQADAGVNRLHSMVSPFELSPVAASIPSTLEAAPVSLLEPGADNDSDAAVDALAINPRLTLIFRDVWVADIPIEEGVIRRVKRHTLALSRRCCPSSTGESSHGGSEAFDGNNSSSGHYACGKPQGNIYAKLDGAAAAGAYFIVPGVSSRFAHSQLHAIMGPSGCGKTSLCKALAGRLPQNRMCGDVRLLCSSAADNFQAEVELTAAGSAGSAAAACNISHMTGFVPQFDQLHESLTVLENLLLAAKLRLPVTGKGQGARAAAWRTVERQRHREVHKVVGEVMALMALTKVATTVVGSSSARLLSGGQRKRVAIAVELVSQPSLLWLDEPTSGLDAAVAYDVVAALKASSERGMNVLAVMHQPRCSIFNMFDSCLLLGANGNVVYSGPQRLALPYMAFLGFYIPPNENVADFLMDVTAGVVARPGDPDYIPSQLATTWHKAGGLWVQQQLRKEHELQNQQHGGLTSAQTLQLTELLPVPPAVQTPVDWPWRPRDLEALLSRFNLLVDSSPGSQLPGRGGPRKAESSYHSSVLCYDGFLTFWDESGIKELLGEEQFAAFIEGLCEDFGMKPGACISKAHFIEVLKAQLRAAAAAAAGMPDEQHVLGTPLHGMPLQTIPQEHASGTSAAAALGAAAATTAAGQQPVSTHKPLDRESAFADYSNTPLPESSSLQYDGQDPALQSCAAALAHCDAAAAAREDAAVLEAAAAAYEEEALARAAAAGCPDAVAALAAAAEAAEAGASCHGSKPEVTPAHTPAQLSRTCSSATAMSYGERSAFAPGVLTCPQARLKQHALMRQRTLMRQASKRAEAGRSGPPGTADTAQRQQQCQQMQQQQQQQCHQHMQALLRCRKARQAAMAAAAQQTGMRQVSQARVMQQQSFTAGGPQQPCASLQEARARCLNQLGEFLVMQESQQAGPNQAPVQQTWSDMCTASSMANGGLQRSHHVSYTSKPPRIAADSPATPEDACAAAAAGKGAKDEAARAAAAAALSSRKLPSMGKQLQIIMLRCTWKAVLCRSALMTDLLLTSVLGLALGVAQSRNIQPGSSVLWMVITLLAYGAITLVRSIRSYGSERFIYLQQESPAGVSVSAWVLGHVLMDMTTLLLHPVLFFAWMYVLTLTPVPAWSYYTTLVAVGFYTSGMGYVVSLTANPSTATIAGLAVALLLGGVANGVVPNMWLLDASHPLLWLDFFSYTRWGLQALYISWLIPASSAHAPATATFLSGLGFCGLDTSLLQALNGRSSGWDAFESKGIIFNATTVSGQQWWNLTSSERSTALAATAAATLRDSPAASRKEAAAAAAITQLWQYYNHPHLLNQECFAAHGVAMAVLVGLGLLCRVLVYVLVRFKVARKAQA